MFRTTMLVLFVAAMTACHKDPTGPKTIPNNPIPGLENPPKETCSNDPKTGEPCVNGAPWSWNGKFETTAGSIATVSSQGELTAINLGNKVIFVRRSVSGDKVTYTQNTGSIALSSNNRPVAFCNGHLYAPRGANLIDEFDSGTGQLLRTLNAQEQMTTQNITSLSCAGQTLVIGDVSRNVYSYNLGANTFVKFFDPASTGNGATTVAVSPNGASYIVGGIAVSGANYPVMFVNTATNQSSGLYFAALSARKPVVAVSWGKHPAAISQDSTLRIYDPATARITCSKLVGGLPTSVASSLDRDYVAVGTSEGNVAVWRVGPSPTCDLVWRSESVVTNGPVAGLNFTAEGMLEAAGGTRVISFIASK